MVCQREMAADTVQQTQCCVYDVTLAEEANGVTLTEFDLDRVFAEFCKHWCFQLERGVQSGFMHFQCRVNWKQKKRLNQVEESLRQKWPGSRRLHVTITNNETLRRGLAFYTTKEDTRVRGPWSDKTNERPVRVGADDANPPGFIMLWDAYQYDDKTMPSLWPWQQYVVDHAKDRDTRTINVVYSKKGNQGRSSLCGWIETRGLGILLDDFMSSKDMSRSVLGQPKSTLYLIDFPRVVDQKAIALLYAAIEKLKAGRAVDDRYSYRKEIFHAPNIWVFTNHLPDIKWLSADRWVIWTVNEQMELVRHRLDTKWVVCKHTGARRRKSYITPVDSSSSCSLPVPSPTPKTLKILPQSLGDSGGNSASSKFASWAAQKIQHSVTAMETPT